MGYTNNTGKYSAKHLYYSSSSRLKMTVQWWWFLQTHCSESRAHLKRVSPCPFLWWLFVQRNRIVEQTAAYSMSFFSEISIEMVIMEANYSAVLHQHFVIGQSSPIHWTSIALWYHPLFRLPKYGSLCIRPSKHETFTQCWNIVAATSQCWSNVAATSVTLLQHYSNIG